MPVIEPAIEATDERDYNRLTGVQGLNDLIAAWSADGNLGTSFGLAVLREVAGDTSGIPNAVAITVDFITGDDLTEVALSMTPVGRGARVVRSFKKAVRLAGANKRRAKRVVHAIKEYEGIAPNEDLVFEADERGESGSKGRVRGDSSRCSKGGLRRCCRGH